MRTLGASHLVVPAQAGTQRLQKYASALDAAPDQIRGRLFAEITTNVLVVPAKAGTQRLQWLVTTLNIVCDGMTIDADESTEVED